MTGAYVMEATGRATCRICEEMIKKGQKAIKVWGWRLGLQVHSDPKDCRR